jgi:hypothetical protein
MSLGEDVRDQALDLGYSRVGIINADPFSQLHRLRKAQGALAVA